MLARLQRSLAFAPSRFLRQISTTSQCSVQRNQDKVIADKLDALLNWEEPARTASAPEKPTETASTTIVATTQPSNGLSYSGLPDHKIFLDLPPAQDPLLQYLTSSLQHDGRRHTAERRAKRVLLYLHTLTRDLPLPLLRKAVERVMPAVRITRHRHSAKDIQIPVALNERQQVRHAVKWMLKSSESRGGRTVEERLAREVILILNGNSSALKQKETLHQLATVNRGNIPVKRSSL